MLALILLILFLGMGVVIARRIFPDYSRIIQSWAGILFGLAGMMWGVALFSLVFGFTVLSHILAVLLMGGVLLIITYALPRKYPIGPRQHLPAILTGTICFFFAVVASMMLMRTFNLYQGAYYAGLPNFGDLPFHLGIITSVVEQKVFPPNYSIFSGVKMPYPFLVDSLSSSLYFLGLSLKWSILMPNLILAWTVIVGFVVLAKEVTRKNGATALAATLFFLNGGFGFVYFLDGCKRDSRIFTRLFDQFLYDTPSLWWEKNIFMGNAICNHIINVRTTLVGWAFLFFIIWILYLALTTKNKRFFVIGGILSGLLPMIHTVSFLCAGMIALTWFIAFLFIPSDRIKYFQRCLLFLVPMIVLSLPQLVCWIFPHASMATGKFMRFHFDWANSTELWIWFWIKNVGLVFLLVIPAFLSASLEKRVFYWPAIVLFVFAECISLSQMTYDNNKVFMIWYAFTAILVADYIREVYAQMEGIRGREVLWGVIIFFCILSAVLTLAHDYADRHELFSKDALMAADFIKENTPPDALFISSDFHNNPITALAGRTILAGYVGWLASFGLDYQQRFDDIKMMYTQPEKFPELQKKYNIDYVYFSDYEKSRYQKDPAYFEQTYPKVFSQGPIRIYAVSEKGRNFVSPRRPRMRIPVSQIP